MNQEQDDMALAALLAAGKQTSPDMDSDIVHKAYNIERASQFDETRDTALKNLQKLIDELVTKGVAS